MNLHPAPRRGRRYLVPEMIQISQMDCGPAALTALLHGWGIRVHSGRLREACQTDVDGTSIETLEETARQLGLDAEQVMLPVDYFLDAVQALPAIVIVRTPGGIPHFVVYWRQHGRFVQVMDPAAGRQFPTAASFAEGLFVHSQAVPAGALLEWLRSENFQRLLSLRLRRLGLDKAAVQRLLDEAQAASDWRPWARLDAAARMVDDLVSSGGVARGREAANLVAALVQDDRGAADIPESYWAIGPATESPSAGGEPERIPLRGAVLVLIHGRLAEEPAETAERLAQLSADVRMALAEPPAHPLRSLVGLLPATELGIVTLAGLGTLAGAALQLGLDVFLRSLLHLTWYARAPLHRFSLFALVSALVLIVCVLSVLLTYHALRLGRYLEIRLRTALFTKLPRLNDHYFSSRPVSDMAERAHSLLRVRQLPLLAMSGLRLGASVVLTTWALSYFLPHQRLLVWGLMGLTLTVPLALQPLLTRFDLRARTYMAALLRIYLDALIGLAPLRTHGGERALARQYEEQLTQWVKAQRRALRYQTSGQGLQLVIGTGLVAWLIARYVAHGGDAAGLLLIFYWAVGLPATGGELAQLLQQYPDVRNLTSRLLEPLGAPSEDEPGVAAGLASAAAPVALALSEVSVLLGGQTVLREVSLDIAAGAHVAVVGASGAGKSTLIGLLLGFHPAASGTVRLDGQPADQATLVQLRPQVAWVDPDVRLWNRSLFDNLHNGHAEGRADRLSQAMATADLRRVIARLPAGLATPLGEGGRLVSGGEGQRVRLGRTLVQPAPRLVLLDEPFRGLDRGQRQELLARVRSTWAETTLLLVTHDIASTLSFPRVLVIEDGRLIEAGEPGELRARPDSRYAALLRAEQAVRRDLWAAGGWERLSMVDGRLSAQPEQDAMPEEP